MYLSFDRVVLAVSCFSIADRPLLVLLLLLSSCLSLSLLLLFVTPWLEYPWRFLCV